MEYVDSKCTSNLETRKYVDNFISDLPTADDVNDRVGKCFSGSGNKLAGNLNTMGNSITRQAT